MKWLRGHDPSQFNFPCLFFTLLKTQSLAASQKISFFIVTLMKPGLRLIASGHFFFYIPTVYLSDYFLIPCEWRTADILQTGCTFEGWLPCQLFSIDNTDNTNYKPSLNFIAVFFTAIKHTSAALTCRPMGPGGPGKPRAPSSPFCPNIPCWPLGPGSPSAPWKKKRSCFVTCNPKRFLSAKKILKYWFCV